MITSVALCTCNGEKYLREQLDSILFQTKSVDEIIICDDASTDGTIEILKNYSKESLTLISVFYNKSPLGTIKNFEKAIALTKGDIIFLSDQDDIWMPNKIAQTSDFFLKNVKCKLFFSDGLIIGENGEELKTTLWKKWGFHMEQRKLWTDNKNAFRDLIHNNNKITGATVCIHKDLKKLGLPIEIPFGYWHDAWFGIHASAVDGLFYSDECLIKYRIHKNQQVGVSTSPNSSTLLKANKINLDKKEFIKYLWQLYPKRMSKINNRRDQKAKKFIDKLLRKFGRKEN